MLDSRIIVMNKATGDCETFGSISELCQILNIEECGLKQLKQNPAFKEKYIFFSFECNLVAYKL